MEKAGVIEGYHDTRLALDPRRGAVWKALWRYYFRHRIGPSDTVLDLGCGYGDFINNVIAARRIALDLWPGFERHLQSSIEPIVGPVSDLSAIADGSVDYAFASNLFEHVSQQDFAENSDEPPREALADWIAHHPSAELSIRLSRIFRRFHACQHLFAHQPVRFPGRERVRAD